MTSNKLTAIAALGAFALSACATAGANAPDAGTAPAQVADAGTDGGDASATPPARASRGGGHGKADFYNAYDANKDGSVSVEEFKQVRDQGYDARDPNSDQQVLVDEYVAEYEGRLEEDIAAMRDRQIKQAFVRFGVLDKDKDGVLTRAEFQASGERMFASLDTNKDGVVNEADDAETY